MATRTIPVHLKFAAYGAAEGVAVVIDRNPADRLRRALSALLLFWACAGIGVFVPLFHFVIVPSFVITGIVMFVLRMRDDASLVEVRGYCPSCKADRVMAGGGRFRDHRKVRCRQCAEQMEVEIADAPAALSGQDRAATPR